MSQPGARGIEAKETLVDGVRYRSRTEARWAIFFRTLGLDFGYERERINLSSGESYLPDFWLPQFGAFFEVKAQSDAIVTEECARARRLSADRPGQRVWLAVGPPSSEHPNVLTLEQWDVATPIEMILGNPENRYYFLQDRRDEGVYWLQANSVSGHFRRTFAVGGPGLTTDHNRLPMMLPRIETAYSAAAEARWG